MQFGINCTANYIHINTGYVIIKETTISLPEFVGIYQLLSVVSLLCEINNSKTQNYEPTHFGAILHV